MKACRVGTPVIGPNLDGVKEYFNTELLSSPTQSEIIKIIHSVYQGEKSYINILKDNLSKLNSKVRKIDII